MDGTGLQPSGGVAAVDVRRGGVNVGPWTRSPARPWTAAVGNPPVADQQQAEQYRNSGF
jgi:hypothetical protein